MLRMYSRRPAMRMHRLAMIDDRLMVRALMIEERRLRINNRLLDAHRADHADDRLMAYADDALFQRFCHAVKISFPAFV